MIYNEFRWGMSRGVVLYKKDRSGNISQVYIQHSMPPPQMVRSVDSYRRLKSGTCQVMDLEGTAGSILGGVGVFQLQAMAIPYVDQAADFEKINPGDEVWTTDLGVIESNVIEIEVNDTPEVR